MVTHNRTRWYTARVTSTAWDIDSGFRRTGNYYDVIIRVEEAYRRISVYIQVGSKPSKTPYSMVFHPKMKTTYIIKAKK